MARVRALLIPLSSSGAGAFALHGIWSSVIADNTASVNADTSLGAARRRWEASRDDTDALYEPWPWLWAKNNDYPNQLYLFVPSTGNASQMLHRLRATRQHHPDANLIVLSNGDIDALKKAQSFHNELEGSIGAALLDTSPHAIDAESRTLQTACDRLIQYEEAVFC